MHSSDPSINRDKRITVNECWSLLLEAGADPTLFIDGYTFRQATAS